MKIAIIVSRFPPKWLAGTEIATYNLARHLVKRGHEIHVVTSRDEEQPNFDKENGFYIHRLAWSKVRIIGMCLFWMKFCLKIRTIKPDIVQVQDLSMAIPALALKKILKIPYVAWGQGDDVYCPNRFGRITIRTILQNADAILAFTENMQIKLKDIYNTEIYIVQFGIDLEEYYGEPIFPDRKTNTKNILFVGSLYPVKGVQYLITAMKKILEDAPDAKLIIVGDGEEREWLAALSIQLGIQKYVQFVGKVPHEKVKTFMQQADVFVLPSLSEGFPNVILEAMACGLPIVASRVGGIPDIIKNGVHGYLVEAKKPDEIAEKILIILQNDQVRNKISRTNLELIKTYAWDTIIFRLENIYLKILKDTEKKHLQQYGSK
jgi:glycosyltransferase involved in cell wall biosynthesis